MRKRLIISSIALSMLSTAVMAVPCYQLKELDAQNKNCTYGWNVTNQTDHVIEVNMENREVKILGSAKGWTDIIKTTLNPGQTESSYNAYFSNNGYTKYRNIIKVNGKEYHFNKRCTTTSGIVFKSSAPVVDIDIIEENGYLYARYYYLGSKDYSCSNNIGWI